MLVETRPEGVVAPGERRPPAWRRRRWRHAPTALGAAAVALVACLQAPGRILPGTKLELVVDPGRFAQRIVDFWDPLAVFGYVPNQVTGYLVPSIPFFAGADLLSLPDWIAQRLFTTAVLLAAYFGTVRLSRALGVGSVASRAAAGVAYALSPMFATLFGTAFPVLAPALVPWAVVPLVHGARRGSPRRAAARSGLAIAAMSGVNAVSTLATLGVPALFLATREAGPRRRRLVLWWIAAVAAACFAWLVALALQDRYAFDFLSFTERASATTATMSAVEALRGLGNWLAYFDFNQTGAPAGWAAANEPAVIAGGVVLAAAGLAGLARRDLPERLFLVATLAAGLLLVGTSYGGAAGSPLAEPVHRLLDGPLAPLRNTLKFQPMVVLPLCVGLAHVLPRLRVPVLGRAGVALATIAALGFTTLPSLRGDVFPPGSYDALPAYWTEAAHWLDEHATTEQSLLVPGAPFGEYTWGRPLDDPLTILSDARVATRDLSHLGSAAGLHVLDAVDRVLTDGVASPGLAGFLRRSGVRYVVVRNDLDWKRSKAPRPAQVRRALHQSPGIRRVASFGPRLSHEGSARDGFERHLRAEERRLRTVEIYEIDGATPGAVALAAAGPTALLGAPETLLALGDHGLLTDAPVVGGRDAAVAGEAGHVVVGDTLRRQDVEFGVVRANRSYTLAPGEVSPHTGRAPHDFDLPGVFGTRSVARYDGGRPSASSYGSVIYRLASLGPQAGVDGDPTTMWMANPGVAGEWLQLDFEERIEVDEVVLHPAADGPWRPTIERVRVETEQGVALHRLAPRDRAVRLPVVSGPTGWVRVTLVEVAPAEKPDETSGPAIREFSVPGLSRGRAIEVGAPPEALAGADTSFVFTSPIDRDSLFFAQLGGEEPWMRRFFTTQAGAEYAVSARAVVRPGEERDGLLDPAPGMAFSFSSVHGSGATEAKDALLDVDGFTGWTARADDDRPRITMRWDEPRRIDRVVVAPAAPPAAVPRVARLDFGDTSVDVAVPVTGGEVTFPAVTADRVSVTFPDVQQAADPETGEPIDLAVGLSSLRLPQLDDILVAERLESARPIDVDCEAGPVVRIDGKDIRFSARTTARHVEEYLYVDLEACTSEPVALGEGRHELEQVQGESPFKITSLVLSPGAAMPDVAGAARSLDIERWDATGRRFAMGGGPETIVAMRENFNEGWSATLDGRRLTPVRVEGWQQGWRVPAGAAGTIEARWEPARTFRVGLAVGAVLLALLVLSALLPGRRAVDFPGAGPRPRRSRWAVAGGFAALAALAGPVALVTVPLAFAPSRWLPRVAAAGMLAAGAIVALQPGRFPATSAGAFGAPAQVLAVVAVAAVVVSLWPVKRRHARFGSS